MENNITYLFGAGASFNSCPIWKEQGDKMVELAKAVGWNFDFSKDKGPNIDNTIKELVWLIGKIGFKANEFNTVDTYARKLYLLQDQKELKDLKKAVSFFFTLWTLSNNLDWKKLDYKNPNNRVSKIDTRYINLLATYLERGEHNPKLPKNIKFVTWNYDLQIEGAFNKFCKLEEHSYEKVNKFLPFIPDPKNDNDLAVCHLNGFHGFYGNDFGQNLFERGDSKGLKELLESFDFLNKPNADKVHFNNYINYAWETDIEMAKIAREKAIEIFSKTSTLVIIGYSFPPFNHSIDKVLFDSLKNIKRVVFQDPNANEDILTETFGIQKNKIVIINKNMDQFVIPNFKEKKVSIY